MTKTMRLLALLLCAVMLFSAVPVQGFATEDAASTAAVADTDVVKVTKDGVDTGYATLQQAFDYIDGYTEGKGFTVANGEVGGTYTVTLLADCNAAVMSAKTYLGSALDVTLDLNGYTISGTSAASVLNITIGTAAYPSTFTIKDSSGNNSGKITGGKQGVIFLGALATLNFDGGTITGNHGATTGGGICCNGTSNQPVINLNGGVITGNSVTGTSSVNTGLGGGVYACQINVNGTVITGNYAYGGTGSYTGRGGGICTPITGTAKYNVVNINTNTVYGNYADNAGDDLMIQKNSQAVVKHTLVIGTENWYIDGWNGANQAAGETDRYSEENPVPYTDGGWTQQKKAVGLKYVAPATPSYTVTYTDGVDGEEIFADQTYTVDEGTATPAFEGTPAREGYTFAGWAPEVTETVTADVTYVAQWEKLPVYVARLESTGAEYETLQAAIDAATALVKETSAGDQTVTLLTDIKESVTISWTPNTSSPSAYNLTIDLNGKTVTGNGGSVFTITRYGSYPAKKLTVIFKDSGSTGKVTGGTGTAGSYSTSTYGGAIYAKSGSSDIVIEGGTWTGNTATYGGVVAAAFTNNTNNVTINGGTLTGNTATRDGGAIYGRYVFVNGGTITGNTAASGGGVYVFVAAATKLEMTGGAIYGNTATTDGDDIIWRANRGAASTAYLKLIAASSMGVDGVTGWFNDDAGNRFNNDTAVEFTTYDKYTTLNTRIALKAAQRVAPAAPDKYGKNVTPALIRVICDTDSAHAPMDIAWQHQSTKVYPGAEVVWNEELGAWTIDIRIDSISVYYVWLQYEKHYNDINHELVPDAPIPEGKYHIDTTLKWDAEAQLWVTMDGNPIEVHTACQTKPTAPIPTWHLNHYQIKVSGEVDGAEKLYYVYLDPASITVGEVQGNRTDGFWAEITVKITNGDAYVTEWIEKRAPGLVYTYDWTKTPETFTFTVYYTGDTTGELYGSGTGDWALANGMTYGTVGEAYLEQVKAPVNIVIYRNGNTVAPYKTVSLGQIGLGETLDLTALNIADYYSSAYGYEFEGWYNDGGWNSYKAGNKDNTLGDEIVINGWTNIICMVTDYQNVQLVIYRNGDTTKPYKTVSLDPVLKGDTLDVSALDIADYYSSTYGYEFDGWFNDGKWNEYKAGKNPAGLTEITVNGWTNIICMVYDYQKIVVYDVTNGDKDNAEVIFNGTALMGENLVSWLDANVTVPEKTGYTVDKWYNWDWYGHKYDDARTVNGWTNVYVAYDAISYSIQYNGGEGAEYVGTEPNSGDNWMTVVNGYTYDAPVTLHSGEGFVRKGYQLVGWTIDGVTYKLGETVEKNFTSIDNAVVQAYAVWELIPLRVYYYINGELVNEFVLETEDEITAYNVYEYLPEKEGYTLTCWYEKAADIGNVNKAEPNGDQNFAGKKVLRLYGSCVANEYTLTLDAGLGTVDPTAVTVTFDAPVGALPVPTREGYTFAGWVDAEGNAVTAETVYTTAGDTALTATWTANSYILTLDAGMGTVDPTTFLVTYDAPIGELPVPTREGYTFAGWVDAEGNAVTAETVYTTAGASTLTATWTANEYTLTLDAGDGTTETVKVTYGEAIGELPVPTKEGYTFVGWVDAEGNAVTAETVYTTAGDTALTATWTANEYTLTLDAGDGTTETVKVTYGEAIGELPVPTKEGYTFVGWLDAEGNLVTEETVYTSAADSVYTASWKEVESESGDTATPGDSFEFSSVLLMMLVCAAGIVLILGNRKRFFVK